MSDVDDGGGLETTGVGIHALKVKINNLYVLMGRELELVDEVPAGNLLGISGLGKCIVKSATVSSTLRCPAFTALTESSLGIIRVAVNTPKPSDLNQLIKGLKVGGSFLIFLLSLNAIETINVFTDFFCFVLVDYSGSSEAALLGL